MSTETDTLNPARRSAGVEERVCEIDFWAEASDVAVAVATMSVK